MHVRRAVRFGGTVVATLPLALACVAAEPQGDAARLQGRWEVVRRTSFNQRQQVIDPRAEFSVDTLRLMGVEGIFLLDETARPKRLRHVIARPDAAEPVTIHYIYMLDGDELVLASECGIGENDGTVAPPAEFNAGLVEVLRLRRVEPPVP